jgi:hypothetical protein
MDGQKVNGQVEMWAVVELMGHGRTAGIMRTSDLGGLLRVDVPIEDGFRTEYYGEAAIYSIKVVSEEIARAYALPNRNIVAYDEPIVPRQQYEEALQLARRNNQQLNHKIAQLQHRLTAVQALPEPEQFSDLDDDMDRHFDEEIDF